MLKTIFMSLLMISTAHASVEMVELISTSPKGLSYGFIEFKDSPYGLIISPNLHGLPPGPHGFHIHQEPNCAKAGMAAGDHLDTGHHNTHLGPYKLGHEGDLPLIVVDSKGEAKTPILAPKLKVSAIKDHAVILHEGGDNYQNQPRLGGGGKRIACGVI